MDHLKNVFAQCQQEGRPALVTYVTAGFPTAEETPDIMLGMQAGGAGESLEVDSPRDSINANQLHKISLNSACPSPILSPTVLPSKNRT